MSENTVSSNAIGIVPLVVGAWYVSRTLPRVLAASADSIRLGAVAGVVGGVAAILIGIGILLGIGGFSPSKDSSGSMGIALSLLAVTTFVVGVGVQIGL